MNNHDRKAIQKMSEHCNHIIEYGSLTLCDFKAPLL